MNSDNKNWIISLPIQVLYYINPQNAVKVFLGIGPDFSYRSYESNQDNNIYNDDFTSSYNRESSEYQYSIGLSSAYGVEWFFLDNMSLTAEYGFSLLYIYREDKYKLTLTDEENTTSSDNSIKNTEGWRLLSNGALFGISVYF